MRAVGSQVRLDQAHFQVRSQAMAGHRNPNANPNRNPNPFPNPNPNSVPLESARPGRGIHKLTRFNMTTATQDGVAGIQKHAPRWIRHLSIY